MSFYFQTSSVLRNDGATGTKGCAASREDPLGRSEAPQRALDDDAAPRPRQGLALENGQSPHALLAHRVAADERHRRGVEADRAGDARVLFAAALHLYGQALILADCGRRAPYSGVNLFNVFALSRLAPPRAPQDSGMALSESSANAPIIG